MSRCGVPHYHYHYHYHYHGRLTKRQKGLIIKWAILGSLFAFFMLWFIGGYIHAKRRLKAGKPLLAYHRVRDVLHFLSS
jgi:hypothetical protein